MRIHIVPILGLCVAAALSIALPAMAQSTNEITKVNPDTAERGTSGLTVTFTLDSDEPPPPPTDILPDMVTIGSIAGYSITHTSLTKVKAVFDFPADEPAGAKDCSVAPRYPA